MGVTPSVTATGTRSGLCRGDRGGQGCQPGPHGACRLWARRFNEISELGLIRVLLQEVADPAHPRAVGGSAPLKS